jgi:hypothetical protein
MAKNVALWNFTKAGEVPWLGLPGATFLDIFTPCAFRARELKDSSIHDSIKSGVFDLLRYQTMTVSSISRNDPYVDVNYLNSIILKNIGSCGYFS